MKFVVTCCVFAAVVAVVSTAALSPGEQPQEDHSNQQQFFREKRSSYGAPYYAPAPCASAPAYLAPIHHPAAAYSPHYGYGIPSLPHYRSVDEEEMMSFSDMDHVASEHMMGHGLPEHMPLARYAYGAPAVPALPLAPHYGGAASAAAIAGLSPAPVAPGPAIGVFPNVKTGGCSVPLLLSCSPTISPGHIVKSHTYSYGGEAYRRVDDPQSVHEEQSAHHGEMNQMTPSHEDTHLSIHQ